MPSDGDQFLGPNLLARSARNDLGLIHYLVSQTELRWDGRIGPTSHKLLLGYEHGQEGFGGSCCDGRRSRRAISLTLSTARRHRCSG